MNYQSMLLLFGFYPEPRPTRRTNSRFRNRRATLVLTYHRKYGRATPDTLKGDIIPEWIGEHRKADRINNSETRYRRHFGVLPAAQRIS